MHLVKLARQPAGLELRFLSRPIHWKERAFLVVIHRVCSCVRYSSLHLKTGLRFISTILS